MGGALYGAVGSGEEECHILAVDGEGDEAEVVGVEGAGSGAGEAVDGAVAVGLGGGGGVETAEGEDGGGGDAAKGLGDDGDHLIALGEGVGVVPGVGGDVAVAGGVVERGLVRLAALLGAEDLVEQVLLGVAKGKVVALDGGGGAAMAL